ncbi:sulfatase [Arenibacter sp. BSSL-BM3]|uniref:Sulfatase n=2 Tax=Arenibacter arenosicollis TaxID=2762274 RepID=A0ABR7QKI3_9FLAO|nr:sulfatase [Arenibacter arenosicollis]
MILITGCKSKMEEKSKLKATSTRPNIILILADDYGIMDNQAYAHKFSGEDTSKMYYETPNIDRLVQEGTAFSQAYANQLCSPTRASIMTGKYAGRLGFTTAMPPRETYYNQNLPVPAGYYAHDVLEHKDNILIEQALDNGTSNSAVPTGNSYDKGKDELSIAEALKDYHSAFIGKWHIGGFGAQGYQPSDQGFEPLAWFDAGGSVYYDWKKSWDNKEKTRFPKMPQEHSEIGDSGQETNEDYLTDDLTVQALNYIDKRSKLKEQPFFLYFSHFAIHSPYQGKENEIAYFENKSTKGWNGHKDPVYASMIKSLDRSVGEILKKLEETGLDENTLVIFMSDNGGIDSKITPKGEGTDNSPFLGGKACVTEGGIRVPLVFRWKGKIKKGQWVDVPVDCTDIYPTILEATGYDAKTIATTNKLDGESVLPLLSDPENNKKSYSKETHYWHYPFNVIYNSPYEPFALTPHSAIRDGDYKLIFDWYGRFHLYNIAKDPFEKNDLASEMTDRRDALFKKMMDWLITNVDKRYWPTVNPDYDPSNEVRQEPFHNLFSEYKEQ